MINVVFWQNNGLLLLFVWLIIILIISIGISEYYKSVNTINVFN